MFGKRVPALVMCAWISHKFQSNHCACAVVELNKLVDTFLGHGLVGYSSHFLLYYLIEPSPLTLRAAGLPQQPTLSHNCLLLV